MKKRLLALAVLGTIAGAAHAQSSVTIYGVMDENLSRVSTGAPGSSTFSQLTGSSMQASLLGFRGTEDMGNGLKAIYDLEMGIAPDTGVGGTTAATSGTSAPAASFFNRGAYVGLSGNNFGTVTLGRNWTAAILPVLNANAIVSGYQTGMVTATIAQGISNDYWNNNQIKYASPNFKGFSYQVSYTFGEAAGSTSKSSGVGGSASYTNGGLGLTFSAQKDNDATGRDVRWQFVTASYKMKALKLTAGFDTVNNNPPVVGGSWRDSKLSTVGASYQFTPRLALAGQYFNVKETATNTTSKQSLLNLDYKFSKRTSIYGLASYVQNGAAPIIPILGAAPGVANANASGYAFGMIHRF